MSVTAKTLGVVLIGLVGLIAYLVVYTGSAFTPVIGPIVANIGLAVGLLLTVVVGGIIVTVTVTE